MDQLAELRRRLRDHGGDSADEDAPLKGGGASAESSPAPQRDGFDYGGFQEAFDINTPDAQGHRFSNRIVARMRSDFPQYLRVRIFDRFDGVRWYASSDRFVKLAVGLTGVTLIAPERQDPAALRSYDIFIEQNMGARIPAVAVPVHLNFPANAVGMDLFGQLLSPAPLQAGTAYSVTSQCSILDGRMFAEREYEPLPTYLQVPDDLDPRIGVLAEQVVAGTSTQLAGAIALEQHLRTHYHYDFASVFESQHYTPLSEFLFDRKSGHCEYFASALAIMLRTRDIPSRLVTGFSATNRNPLTGYFDIHALDGHAWVEAFVDNTGWVVLEPTAYYDGPLPEEEKLSARQINAFVERQIKRRRTLGEGELTIEGLFSAFWHLSYLLVTAALAYLKLFLVHQWPLLAAAVLILAAAWFGWQKYKGNWLAYRIHRQVAAYEARQADEAVSFYLNAIERLLRHAGLFHAPGDTIERFMAHLHTAGVKDIDRRLVDSFNRIYYNRELVDLQAAEDYKLLFQRLYDIGYDNLAALSAKAP